MVHQIEATELGMYKSRSGQASYLSSLTAASLCVPSQDHKCPNTAHQNASCRERSLSTCVRFLSFESNGVGLAIHRPLTGLPPAGNNMLFGNDQFRGQCGPTQQQ
eukprot:scpid71490/ scgid10158/ 